MAPKRKTRAGAREVSTPTADVDGMDIDAPTPEVEEPKGPPTPAYDILKDPWTDEQETSLFKGIIRWKPSGNGAQKFNVYKALTGDRHAQALPNDRIVRVPSKSWLRSNCRQAYANTSCMGEAWNTLQYGHH
jgi:hypothetical protein